VLWTGQAAQWWIICKRIIFCRKPMRLCQLLSIQFLSW